MMNPLPTVGFVGTGIMGASMAGHLLAAGYPLHVFNRTRRKAEPLLAAGAVWCESPEEVAASAEIVVSIVGMPADVEEIYFGRNGKGGMLAAARPGSLLIDMTTSSPSLAERIAEAAAARGVAAVDAPVSGGDVGARKATLVIMAGGDEAACERALPLVLASDASLPTRLPWPWAWSPGARPWRMPKPVGSIRRSCRR
jgi:3-hydroxyisobutyrate dehydrogenase